MGKYRILDENLWGLKGYSTIYCSQIFSTTSVTTEHQSMPLSTFSNNRYKKMIIKKIKIGVSEGCMQKGQGGLV